MAQVFEEKILYRTHQHWIIPVMDALKLILFIALPASVMTYFLSGYSWGFTLLVFFVFSGIFSWYDHYLWSNSWLMVGNQKITLSVRNRLWSQYAMNIRYRNIRDSAVSKNSFLGYLLKFGTLFVRSSANEGDFQAHFVPKVGKVYALVNALSRYSDEERTHIHTIEELHRYHQNKEFATSGKHLDEQSMSVDSNIARLENIIGVTAVVELDAMARQWIGFHEETRNHGVMEVLRRESVIAFLHNSSFRQPAGDITAKTATGEVYFPGVPFPEVVGKNVISGSPSAKIHLQLAKLFPYADRDDATVLVGWDKK